MSRNAALDYDDEHAKEDDVADQDVEDAEASFNDTPVSLSPLADAGWVLHNDGAKESMTFEGKKRHVGGGVIAERDPSFGGGRPKRNLAPVNYLGVEAGYSLKKSDLKVTPKRKEKKKKSNAISKAVMAPMKVIAKAKVDAPVKIISQARPLARDVEAHLVIPPARVMPQQMILPGAKADVPEKSTVNAEVSEIFLALPLTIQITHPCIVVTDD